MTLFHEVLVIQILDTCASVPAFFEFLRSVLELVIFATSCIEIFLERCDLASIDTLSIPFHLGTMNKTLDRGMSNCLGIFL